jgi:hypothetical protein
MYLTLVVVPLFKAAGLTTQNFLDSKGIMLFNSTLIH